MFAQSSCEESSLKSLAKNHMDDKLLSGVACKSFLCCSCDFFFLLCNLGEMLRVMLSTRRANAD